MNKSDTYIVFGEWEEDFDDLTDEELGSLTRAFFAYVRRGENPTFSDRMVRSCWRKAQQASDRSSKAYEAKCEQNKENGKKGGRPKKTEDEKPKKPNGYFGFSEKTEKTLPDPYPDPKPNRNPNYKKTKFHNFDERNYSSEQMNEIEKKLGGNI